MKTINRHICKRCKVQFNAESSVCPSCNEDTITMKLNLPETDEEITEFLRALDAGEIECPPPPNAKLIVRMCVMKTQCDKLEAECTRLHGLWHAAEERNNVLREAVKPVIEALAGIADTDDFRGVAKALVRCHSLLDKFPDLYSQNA